MNNKTGPGSKAFIALSVIILAIFGYRLYGVAIGYEYLSPEHVLDIMRAKLWTIGWLLISFVVVYLKRKSPIAPYLTVLALSIYFVIAYGLFFKGTEFGIHGHWGDNSNRIALICKMMAYNTLFTDWYIKDLPSFYPPLWFGVMAVYGKILGIEAYQTIKFGYLLIFLTYPWLLFYAWRKVVSPAAAAGAVVATIFFGYKHLDWIYYEHMTAALFMPWWLYYFEGGKEPIRISLDNWRFYVIGSLFGGLLFMTYYYWYFLAAIVLPVTLIVQLSAKEPLRLVALSLLHKVVLMTGVAVVSSVYWLPLLLSFARKGIQSAQSVFFGVGHANITSAWSDVSLNSIFIIAGIFFSCYLWKVWGRGKLPYLFLGGVLLILLDRVFNLNEASFQSRKVLEFAHVFAVAPLGIGIVTLFQEKAARDTILKGIVGLVILAALITSNHHTQIYEDKKYQMGLSQRIPQIALEVYDGLETYGKVCLTNDRSRELCYLPVYMFIPVNNMSAHTAGQYLQRWRLLVYASKIVEPELLAYALKYNRYSAIDYVYLGIDRETGKLFKLLNQGGFNQRLKPRNVLFEWDYKVPSEFIVKRNKYNMFEIIAPERSDHYDEMIRAKYPKVSPHLIPAS